MARPSGLSRIFTAAFAAWLWLTVPASAWENDGWISETFSDSAQRELNRLADQISASNDHVSGPLVTPRGGPFVLPASDQQVYRDPVFDVQRSGSQADRFAGYEEFLAELRKRLKGVEDRHCHFKIVRVSLGKDDAETHALASVTGRSRDGRFEQSSRWHVKWQLKAGSPRPRILQIAVSDIETIRTRGTSGRPVFADATSTVSTGVRAFQEQLAHGQSHWQRRIEAFHGILNPAQNGLSVADVNGDGLDDLYVCQPGGLPNRLFLRRSDGTLLDATASSGTNFLDNSHCALFVDVDNDGDQDMFLATAAALLLLENRGQAEFRLVRAMAEIKDAYSLAAADYDNDGDVDLFACIYFPSGADVTSLPVPIPYFDAKNGGPNHLLRNQGGWKFVDVTRQSGIADDNRRFSYAVAWLDYDNDGDQDLYVANDFGPDNLYRNSPKSGGVAFEEISASVGIQHGAFGMSVAAGDFNRDGFEDIYVANMYSSAGNRVTRQSRFRPTATPQRRTQFQRLASGNSLFKNIQGRRFDDVGEAAGVALGRWSWGANFVDLNNDGWEDLLVTNGYITGDDPNDL